MVVETADEDLINQVASIMGGWFGLVICDEVHLFKHTNLLMQRVVELVYAEENLFLTATPMVKCPINTSC